ncbi:outer membrane beta-barrel protein [Leptospira vanthielii]|uniref:Outer membrane protein beta-barrel domain-containing protein n=1 Tax=Leptospira vanthielii TaxID=293085 RepID=A0ABY2NS96_9LEPT|nr:outer membrane beta-barrel protein [Leptospira vanthielii]TGM59420.1 hypothetical protein EHQ95_06885 [Leptospira vanthielii]
MKKASNISYFLSILFILVGFHFPVFSQTVSQTPTPIQKKEIHFGFYEGRFSLQVTGGDTIYTGGSLTNRETSYQNSLKTQSDLGLIQKRLLATANVPNGLPLPESKFNTGRTERVTFEYGLTDHIGITASLSNNTVSGKRLNQFVLSDRTNPNGFSPYLEAVPTNYRFYEDKIYGLGINYHIFAKNRFDPYVGIELGLVNFNTSYRSYNNNSLFLYSSIVSGLGYSARIASGFNYHITPEFGFTVEIHGIKRKLKSDAFPSETFEQVGFQFGVIFNLDNMGNI